MKNKLIDTWEDSTSMKQAFINAMAKKVSPKGNKPERIDLDLADLPVGTVVPVFERESIK